MELNDIQYKEYAELLNRTHGKSDNRTIWNLISEFNCTADDLEGIAKKTKNENYLMNQTLIQNSPCGLKRLISSLKYTKNKDWKTFRDYEWYFKNMPDEYKDMYIFDSKAIQELFIPTEYSGRHGLGDKGLSLYAYNYGVNLLKENYPSDFFVGRLKDSLLYDSFALPYTYKHCHVQRGYSSKDGDNISARAYSQRYASHYDNILSYLDYDYDKPEYEQSHNWDDAKISTKTLQGVVEQMVQLDLLSVIMENEIYDQEQLKAKNDGERTIYCYSDYLFSRYRKTGIRRSNHPQKVRLEFFGQIKALEMLLAMGLGVKLRSVYSYDVKPSNKKFNKRIQTAYKTFIKAKTVDDRKAIRELLKKQLSIISNDFMGNNLSVVELRCVEKQDEMFESGATKVVASRTKVKPVKSGATFVKKSFDLSKLAQATTQTVEKGRN